MIATKPAYCFIIHSAYMYAYEYFLQPIQNPYLFIPILDVLLLNFWRKKNSLFHFEIGFFIAILCSSVFQLTFVRLIVLLVISYLVPSFIVGMLLAKESRHKVCTGRRPIVNIFYRRFVCGTVFLRIFFCRQI